MFLLLPLPHTLQNSTTAATILLQAQVVVQVGPLSFALASKGSNFSYLDILMHLLNVVFIHMDLNSL